MKQEQIGETSLFETEKRLSNGIEVVNDALESLNNLHSNFQESINNLVDEKLDKRKEQLFGNKEGNTETLQNHERGMDCNLLKEEESMYQYFFKQQEDIQSICLDYIEELETKEKYLIYELEELNKKIERQFLETGELERKDTAKIVNIKHQKDVIMKELSFTEKLKQQEMEQYKTLEETGNKLEMEFKEQSEVLALYKHKIEEMERKDKEEQEEFIKLEEELRNLLKQRKEDENQLIEFKEKRREINNELQTLKGNIRVYLRIKPLGKDKKCVLKISDNHQLTLLLPAESAKSKHAKKSYEYKFEHIFDHGTTQKEIFEELQGLMQSVIDGFNVCIFAYGPTGTGKTYTITGDGTDKNKGLAPRAIESLFKEIEANNTKDTETTCQVQMLELYNNKEVNLLDKEKMTVHSFYEAFQIYTNASKKRVTAGTNINDQSSRSHLIFKLSINIKKEAEKKVRNGTLVLVDLAGSERYDMVKTKGDRFKETVAINASLTQLGVVITAMHKGKQHIPFRNSKLTQILQNYLQGDSKTLMVVNLSSDEKDYNQTLNSLKFASKVKECETLKIKDRDKFLAPTTSSNNKSKLV